MVRRTDTSPAAASLQAQIFRRMTPSERVALACQMSDELRAISAAGIEARHPHFTSEQKATALLELMLGRDLAARVRQQA